MLEIIGGVIQDSEEVEKFINKVDSPYIKGEDLDWTDDELVRELEGSEFGADPFAIRRV